MAVVNCVNFIFGIGGLVSVSKNIDIDFTYKYVDLGDFTTHGISVTNNTPLGAGFYQPSKGRLTVHEFLMSIHIKFK